MYRSFRACTSWPRSSWLILGTFSVAWLSAATVLVWLGVADGEILSDDAYYYFEISRNAALGEGFTFDGVNPTNGFHPLWGWLLVPVFLAFPTSAWTPIHIALTISGMCVVASAVCVFLLFERHGRTEAGLASAVLWLFNPFTWVLSGRGLEGPLNVLCIMIAVLVLDSIRLRGTYHSRDAVALGGAFGLSLLARTDNVLLVAAFGLVLLGDVVRGRLRPAVALRRAAVTGATTALVVSPWLAWSLATFGSVVQSSHQAKSLFDLYGRLPALTGETGTGLVAGMVRNLGLIASHNAQYIAGEEWSGIERGWTVLAWAATVAVLATASAVLFRSRRGSGPALAPVALFAVVHIAWYGWIGRSYYNWYFLPVVLVCSLLVADALGRAWASGRRTARAAVGVTIALIAISAPRLGARHIEGWAPRQGESAFLGSRAAERLAPLPAGSRAGAWNAGRIGYFASFHSRAVVVNLDGVVNNEIVRHARTRPYESYILEHIDWLLEDPRELRKFVSEDRMVRFVRDHVSAEGQILGGPPDD